MDHLLCISIHDGHVSLLSLSREGTIKDSWLRMVPHSFYQWCVRSISVFGEAYDRQSVQKGMAAKRGTMGSCPLPVLDDPNGYRAPLGDFGITALSCQTEVLPSAEYERLHQNVRARPAPMK
jgi:hypothetical protein